MSERSNLWWTTAPTIDPAPALAGHVRCDVAVIGAGIMGAAAARALSWAGAKVAIVEADRVGAGASSRPGGFVVPSLSVGAPAEVIGRLGAEGEAVCRLVATSAQRLFDIVREDSLDCDAQQGGWYQPAHSAAAADRLARSAADWMALGAPGEMLDAHETALRTGAKGYAAAWFARSGGTIHPLNYCRGLIDRARVGGAMLYEGSPVVAIERKGGVSIVRTAQGSIEADQVLVCTNAQRAPFMPAFWRGMVRLKVWQSATAPIPAEQRQHLFADGASLSDTREDLFTYRFDRDWRLVTGALDMFGMSSDRLAARMGRRLQEMLSLRERPEIKYLWSGDASVSAARLPVTFMSDDGVLAASSCNARGIALSTVVGEALAARALGSEAAPLPHLTSNNRGSVFFQQRLARLYPWFGILSDWLGAKGRIASNPQ